MIVDWVVRVRLFRGVLVRRKLYCLTSSPRMGKFSVGVGVLIRDECVVNQTYWLLTMLVLPVNLLHL